MQSSYGTNPASRKAYFQQYSADKRSDYAIIASNNLQALYYCSFIIKGLHIAENYANSSYGCPGNQLL